MQKTDPPLLTEPDPVIAELRLVREKLLRKHDFDLHKVCEDLREREKEHPSDRFFTPNGAQ